MSSHQVLDVRNDGAVRILTLGRPDSRNALNTELCNAISAAIDDLNNVRAIVVTGEGSAFCAGADLNGVYGDEFITALYAMLKKLTEIPVPVIAAVNGPAIGAGTQLAMACDLRIADDTAKFAVPTAKNGMAVDGWTIQRLAQLAGHGMAGRLMLAAETIDRNEALQCGLVDRSGDLGAAVDWAQEIALLAPLALAHNKLVLNSGVDAEERIVKSFTEVWASEDVKEAALARTEKRTPVFTGN